MPVQKLKFVKDENEKNGGYYIDEAGNKVNHKGTKDVVYFDTELNRDLNEKEIMVYEEQIEEKDDWELSEEELEDMKDNGKISEELEHNDGIHKELFETEELNDLTQYQTIMDNEIAQAFNLDKTKEYLSQNVNKKTFQNGVKFLYQDYKIGHTSADGDFAKFTTSEIFKQIGQTIASKIAFSNDKDTRMYWDKLAKQERELADEDEKKNTLIYNDNSLNGLGGEQFYKMALRDDERQIFDIDNEVKDMERYQLGAFYTMLGNGIPERAYHQFLDSNALKNGEYKYDEKKITKFMKSNLMTRKEMEKFVASQMRVSDYEALIEKTSIEEKYDEKTLDFEEALDEALTKHAEKNSKTRSSMNELKDIEKRQILDDYIEKNTTGKMVELNEKLVEKASLYSQMKEAREKRGRSYAFFHPINNRKFKQMEAELKQDITDNLVEGSSFKEKMEEFLDKKPNSKEAKELLGELNNLTKEPIEGEAKEAYQEKVANMFKVNNMPEDFGIDKTNDRVKTDKVKEDLQKEVKVNKIKEVSIDKEKQVEKVEEKQASNH